MFDIAFLGASCDSPDVCIGRIRIGDFTELFESSLDLWQIGDHRLHWHQSIRRVVECREDSCLLTSLTDPRTANFLFWWPIYVIDRGTAVVQSQVLFLQELKIPFEFNTPHLSLQPREVMSETGEPISEWKVSIAELSSWLAANSSLD